MESEAYGGLGATAGKRWRDQADDLMDQLDELDS